MTIHSAPFALWRVTFVTAVLLGLGVSPLRAGDIESFWISPFGGDFDDPKNWDGPVPDETITAIFQLDASPFVGFQESNTFSDRLIVREGDVSLQLWSHDGTQFVSRSYMLLNPLFNTPSIVVGETMGPSVQLTIRGGELSGQSMVMGLMPGSSGAVEFFTITNLVPSLVNQFQLHVGYQGQGVLTIADQVTVTNSAAVLGALEGSSGHVTVTGEGSLWDCFGPLSVGKFGMGALDVSDEAKVVSASAIIGQQLGSIGAATVTDPGSFWSINGSLDVGLVGQGSMTISNGGTVFTDGFVTLGTFPEVDIPPKDGGTGDVTVTGPASFWFIGGDLYVGFMWLGTLSVLEGATVTSDNGFVGTMFGGMGDVIIQGPGSVWSNAGDVSVTSVLTVAEGGIVVADSVLIEAMGQLDGDGAIEALVTNEGFVRPGYPTGTLTINGSFANGPTGDLHIELADSDPGGFDAIAVQGPVSLGGTLNVSLIDGFVPIVGDTFTIITANFISGDFDLITLPKLPPPRFWEVIQDMNSVTLLVGPVIPGDIDGDGIVGVSDLLFLLGNWGPCADCNDCPADLDGDCSVGVADFLILLANWG